jgi:hypothetical protein
LCFTSSPLSSSPTCSADVKSRQHKSSKLYRMAFYVQQRTYFVA